MEVCMTLSTGEMSPRETFQYGDSLNGDARVRIELTPGSSAAPEREESKECAMDALYDMAMKKKLASCSASSRSRKTGAEFNNRRRTPRSAPILLLPVGRDSVGENIMAPVASSDAYFVQLPNGIRMPIFGLGK